MRTLEYLYESELMYVTDKVWDFYNFLNGISIRDKTMFIVTSDHGESLGEHGLWGHNFGLYNEVTHIPLIIKYPKDFGLSGEVRQLCQLQDLFATIMEVARSPFPVPESSKSLLSEHRRFALGEHLIPLGIRGILRRDPHFLPTKQMQPCRTIINADLWKLIQWQDGRLELFNIKTDYAEAYNLINDMKYLPVKNQLFSDLNEELGLFPPINWDIDT